QGNRLTGPVFGDEELDVGENTVAVGDAVVNLCAGGGVNHDDVIRGPISAIYADEFTGEVFILVGVDDRREIEAAAVVIRGGTFGSRAGSGPGDGPRGNRASELGDQE